jgi:Ni/Co efflux regulator RcnB
MKARTSRLSSLALACALSLTLGAGPAFANKPEWAGQGKGGPHGDHPGDKDGKKQGKHGKPGGPPTAAPVTIGGYFAEPQREAARRYYGAEFQRGKCPPGLAKKNNGCLPPGQARKWGIGQPLPRDVVYYPVPQAVVVQLGAPPAGYKYVRVAADILLIAVGTMLVVDAIQDLSRM